MSALPEVTQTNFETEVLHSSQPFLQGQCSSLTEMLRRAKRERSGRSGTNDLEARLDNRAVVVQEVPEVGHAADLSELL